MENNRFKRLWQHWLYPSVRMARYLPKNRLEALTQHISASEQQHNGEIRFVVESRLPSSAILAKQQPRNRARQWFGELGVWDTEHNNGILVYVCIADRAVEIIADRGISALVDEKEWQAACNAMLPYFARHHFSDGLEAGLNAINTILVQHFPSHGQNHPNELPDNVIFR